MGDRRLSGRPLSRLSGNVHFIVLLASLVFVAMGCSEEPIQAQVNAPDAVAPEGDVEVPDPVLAPDCSEFEFNGETFDCSTIDRCDPSENIYLLSVCANCDITFANPPAPGTCPPDPNEPVVVDAPEPDEPGESCMFCHNGSRHDDYAGRYLSNPHPFPPADNIKCTTCHGGNGAGEGKLDSHVPPPPGITGGIVANTQQNLQNDEKAYFNRLTLVGIDKFEPAQYSYPNEIPGRTFTNLDYLQFVNPGDLRVVAANRGCGDQGCHDTYHAQWVARSPIATTTGIFSGTRFAVGVENRIPEHRAQNSPGGLEATDGDSLADSAPRAVNNPVYNEAVREVGEVGSLVEQPEYAQYGPGNLFWENFEINVNNLANGIYDANQRPTHPNTVKLGSTFEKLIDEQVSITCGNCHLYSAGDNNRFGDFRSSGCTACHMEYSYDGRSRSTDQHVNRLEPANPDAIAAPERAHIETHQIRNVVRNLDGGGFVRGISDRACVGCHQGSNRTVLQFWGIRLDQNRDLTTNFQYPANPVDFTDTTDHPILFDPANNNNTFNGRDAQQYILEEDYDGDGRDDTPPDVHHAAGMGCIDCHGGRDLHGGKTGDVTSGKILSRQDQATAITCTDCHGGVDSYTETTPCTTHWGEEAICAVDSKGNPIQHVTYDPQSQHFWLKSRVTGRDHYLVQTRDVTIYSNKVHPIDQTPLYSAKASYAMGRADGNDGLTGIGPKQADPLRGNGFSHLDTMDCASCHAAWTNNCIGCHLATEYDADPNNYHFSNITGERIVLDENAADFVYQSPVMMYLGVNSRGKITQISPAEKVFWRYVDINGDTSDVFAFSDRLGEGNNPNTAGRNAFPALSHNQMAPHSIRGKISPNYEGPRYCVTCHMTEQGLNDYGAEYEAFRANYQNNNFANLDFPLLQAQIGSNTGNANNSPFFPHMVAGLGSGLFLFDENGCPVNPLDANANREYCQGNAPANNFNVNNVKYDLDRIVEYTGVTNSSSIHPMLGSRGGQARRGIASTTLMAGPLSGETIRLLTDPDTGLVLDSWLDADGVPAGQAADFIQQQ